MNRRQDSTVFEAYKPLRNALRKLDLADSLAVLNTYMSHLQFNQDISRGCEVHRDYLNASLAQKRSWISEFRLEALCRELILHAKDSDRPSESIRHWKFLSRAMNLLNHLEGLIAERINTPELLLQEIHRVAHRQLPWQEFRPTSPIITRYRMIYGHPALAPIVHSSIGLQPEDLFLHGLSLLGSFIDKFALRYPPQIHIPGVSHDGIERFLLHFSKDISNLRSLLKQEQEMNDRFFYAYTSLRAYPIIRMKYEKRDCLVCPAPTLLFWRFTSGVYYEIYKSTGFENAFGKAFQWYAGQVLEKGTKTDRTRIYPEEEYSVGKFKKQTVDWRLEQNNAVLFIECKTKRMTHEAKIQLGHHDSLASELDKMAAMIVQLYKAIKDYREGRYPNHAFDPSRKIYPMVVTLEDWFLMGPTVFKHLDEEVRKRMDKERVPLDFLSEMPFTVCSMNEFEQAVQVMDHAGISTIMGSKIQLETRDWTLSAYLRDKCQQYSGCTQFLFKDEFNAIGAKAIREWQSE